MTTTMSRRTLFAALGLGGLAMVPSSSGADLAPLFAPPPHPSAHPMSYRQGVVLEWNPATLANRVRIGGTGGPEFTNLPVLGVAEAATLRPGSVVGIMVIADPDRGAATYAILGRLVTPGTAEATEAITGLSRGIHSATVNTFETTSSASYTDLSTLGPTCADVLIGASGRALVMPSCAMGYANQTGLMSFSVRNAAGNEVLAPDDTRAYKLSVLDVGGAAVAIGSTRVIEVSGLTPGTHSFQAKYRANASTPNFAERNLTVIAL